MIGNLSACLARTLHYEGGWSDNPRDPGGATMEGITLNEYRRAHPGASKIDLRNISVEDRDAIYHRDYWTRAGCDALPAGLDLCAFDAAVNSGPGAAARWLARAGSGTSVARIKAFSAARLGFLEGLRTFRVFGRGWAARVAGIEATALRMALGFGPVANVLIAKEGKATATKAAQTRVGGHTVVIASGASAATQAHHASAVPPVLIVAGMLIALILAGLIYWRATHHSARASALAAA